MADFPSSLTGTPTRIQRQVRPQPNFDEKNTGGTFRDFRHNGGAMPIVLEEVEAAQVAASQSPAPLPGKRGIPAFAMAATDVNPNDYGQLIMLANFFGFYSNEDNTTWRRWQFGLSEATSADRYLEMREDSDAILRHATQNGRVFSANFEAAPNGTFGISFNGATGRYDFFEAPTQTAGSGSDLPTILGANMGVDVWDDAVDADVFVRIDTVSGDDLTISVKVGTAGSYGSTPQAYTMGNSPVRLKKDGVHVGSQGRPLMFFMASGSTLTALDEFEIAAPIARWAQSLPARKVIPAVNTQLYINGSEVSAEGGWSVNMAWATTGLQQDVSKEEGGKPQRTGDLVPTVQISRELADTVLAKIAHERTSVPIVIESETVDEITSGVPYRLRIVIPSGRIAGSLYSPGDGATNTEESYTLVGGTPDSAYSWDGQSYADNVTVEVHNNLTSL